MKKINFLFILLLSILVIACGSSGGNSSNNNENSDVEITGNLDFITIKSDKLIIKNDGEDKAIFEIICYDYDGNEFDGNVKLYSGDKEIKGNYFTSLESGNYTISAKSIELNIESNKVVVTVIADNSGESHKILKTIFKNNSIDDGENSLYYIKEYNNKGKVISEKYYTATIDNSNYRLERYLIYDLNENLIEENYYGYLDTLDGWKETLMYTYIHEYNEINNKIKSLKVCADTIYTIYEFSYNENNNLIRKDKIIVEDDIYSSEIYNHIIYEYNENGDLKTETWFIDGEIIYFYEYIYDENRNLVEKKENNKEEELLNYTKYEYDENNKNIKKTEYILESLSGIYTYEYDSEDRLIKELYMDENNILKNTIEINYIEGDYDDFINKMVEFK